MISWTYTNVAVALVAVWASISVLQKFLSIRNAFTYLGDCPGRALIWLNPVFQTATVLSPLYPRKGEFGYFWGNFSSYQKYGSTVLSSVTFAGSIPTFWIADADALKPVFGDRNIFQKDVTVYEPLNIYGRNMVGLEGAEWKRHRTVAAPAFNEANNALVWADTMRVVSEWFKEIDAYPDVRSEGGQLIDVLKDITQATLLVISSAGFGRRVGWSEDSTQPPPGHTMAFHPAICTTIKRLFTKILTPNWIDHLSKVIYIPIVTPVMKETREAFASLHSHMLEVVSQARAQFADGKGSSLDAALLRNLVHANMNQEEGSSKHLSDDELLSNTFTFFLAGHETSAHTLSFALAMLALHPDAQKKVYEEVTNFWPEDSAADPPTAKEAMPKLDYTTAVLHETLRFFPSVPRLAKMVHADTCLNAHRFASDTRVNDTNVQEYVVPLPAGSMVVIDMNAVHNNPLHWGDDVDIFRPERFIDTETYHWPRDAFLAFSRGARSCIGQRFAVTESVCILANIVRKYEILLPDDLQSKSFEQQKEILSSWSLHVTMTPNNSRVKFRQRT